MFAGINNITDTLRDRSIKIPLLRKKKNEVVLRYRHDKSMEQFHKKIRSHLYLASLKKINIICDYYNNIDKIKGIPDELNDRLCDILEPLFVIANVIAQEENSKKVIKDLRDISITINQENNIDNEDESHVLLRILSDYLIEKKYSASLEKDAPIIILTDELYSYFLKTVEFPWLKSKNTFTSKLKKIKINNNVKTVSKKTQRFYFIEPKVFKDLCDRFDVDY